MWKHRRFLARWFIGGCLVTVAAIAACATQDSVTPQGVEVVQGVHPALTGCLGYTKPGGSNQGEILGNLYENGERTCDTTQSMSLAPDATTAARMDDTFNGSLRIYPWYPIMFEFWDPNAGAPCAGFSATTASSNSELIHSTLSGTEHHCVMPGFYTFSGPGDRQFQVEYVQVSGYDATNSTAGVNDEHIEITAYDSTLTSNWNDLWIHTDVTSTHPGDTPVLDIRKAGSTPYDGSFANQSNPSGTADDWFQFSTARSSSNWLSSNNHRDGGALARLRFYDGATLFKTLGYYDYYAENHALMRLSKFPDPWPDTLKTYTVILNLLRPDEAPSSANDYTSSRSVVISTTHSTAVSSVAASIGSSSIVINGTTTATAVTKNAANEVLSWHSVTWSSLDSSIATVNSSTGLVTGVAAGSTAIRATSDDGVHYAETGVTVLGSPTITSFSWSCVDTPANGHHYNVFTKTWTYSGNAAGYNWYVKATNTSTPPNPGYDVATGSSGTTADDEWWRNDTSQHEDWYYWVRYGTSGSWYAADNGAADKFDAYTCMALRQP